MVYRFVIGVSIIAGIAVTSPRAQEGPSSTQSTFRTAVDMVTIQASVRDGRGRVVSGLKTADFEVRDNGQVRPIVSFRSDRQSPLSVAIVADVSGSMRVGPKIAMARTAFDSLLSRLRQAQDEVALFTFDAALHERSDFTRDLATLKNGLDDLEAFGTTSLYDGTAAAARRLAARTGTHKAIVLLTDGIDTSSAMTAREVSGLASSIDVPVFVVSTLPPLDQRILREVPQRATGSDAADLRDLAEWTGGRFVFASTFDEAVVAASNLIDELRQQYVLSIEAATAREWRRLEVRVRRPSAVVKARSGYFAG